MIFSHSKAFKRYCDSIRWNICENRGEGKCLFLFKMAEHRPFKELLFKLNFQKLTYIFLHNLITYGISKWTGKLRILWNGSNCLIIHTIESKRMTEKEIESQIMMPVSIWIKMNSPATEFAWVMESKKTSYKCGKFFNTKYHVHVRVEHLPIKKP